MTMLNIWHMQASLFNLQLSSSRSLPYRWWEEQELRDLTASMGLQNFQRHRQNRFIMFAVSKPHEARKQS